MKFLFDLRSTQPGGSGKRHGAGRYGEAIFRRMIELGINFSCYYDSRRWFNPDIKAVVENKEIELFDTAQRRLQEIINAEHFDRIFTYMLTDEELFLKNIEVFGTIHGIRAAETPPDDVSYFSVNENCDLKKRAVWYIRKATRNFKLRKRRQERLFQKRYVESNCHLITVSEHSKYAMQSYFPQIAKREVKVFYSPNTSLKTEGIKMKSEFPAEKYFLCVSANRWEKNVIRAIIAFDRLKSFGQLQDFKMKISGATKDEMRCCLQNPASFDFLGYVSDEELEQLYAKAYLFVFPSLNEGFGYPPIEAMKYGTPVIASAFSSMAEICASGALFFNPLSIEEIMNRMLMMTDSSTHEKFSKLGYQQYLRVKSRQDKDLDELIKYITS